LVFSIFVVSFHTNTGFSPVNFSAIKADNTNDENSG
jgi:hypothetical protein